LRNAEGLQVVLSNRGASWGYAAKFDTLARHAELLSE